MISLAILFIGLSQTLFALVVILSRRDRRMHDLILAAALATIAFKFLIHLMHAQHPRFFDIDFSLGLVPLTFGPFIYLYARYITTELRRFRVADLLHFLPFAVLTIVYFALLKDEVDFRDTRYLALNAGLAARLTYAAIFFTSIVAYTGLTLHLLHRYRLLLVDFFSFRTADNRLLWVNALVILYASTFGLYFVAGGLNAVYQREFVDLGLLSHAGLTVLAFVTSYFGVKQPSLFSEPDQAIPVDADAPVSDEDASPTRSLDDDVVETYRTRLLDFMETERPHLEPELTLGRLSDRVNIPKHDLSLLLNRYIGKNFFHFVNEYRVKEVVRRMGDARFDHLTLQAIAYDSGFKSKSTFNAFFKQTTGATPSAYKEDLLRSKSVQDTDGQED